MVILSRCTQLISALLLILPLGCRRSGLPATESLFASIPCSSLPEYFPFPNSGTGDLFWGTDEAEWEGNYLQHMKEPSLYTCGTVFNTQPQYRFLWDRSLSEPIAVRLQVHPNGAGTLFVRELANGGMIPPPMPGKKAPTWDEWFTLKTGKTVEIDVNQTQQITHLFDAVFQIPFDPNPIGNTTDGSDWIFESRVEGRYRLRDFRNVPIEPSRTLGLLLVRDLGSIPIQPEAIY